MRQDEPVTLSWGTVVGFALAWLLLLLVHYCLMFVFAGWLGTADGFIPWSLAALVLWHWTRRYVGFSALPATHAGRVVLSAYGVLLLAAVLGVDEGRVPHVPAVPAAVGYALVPIVVLLAVWTALLAARLRQRRVSKPAT